jgi:hypothetical protein
MARITGRTPRGDAAPVVFHHRLDHVLDERLDFRGFDFFYRHGSRLLAQHRMAHDRDFSDCHKRGESTQTVKKTQCFRRFS